MSLARRGNGCVQCRNRRIQCDKNEPRCDKCTKKGIECSGQGLEFRPLRRPQPGIPRRPKSATKGAVNTKSALVRQVKTQQTAASSPESDADSPVDGVIEVAGRFPTTTSIIPRCLNTDFGANQLAVNCESILCAVQGEERQANEPADARRIAPYMVVFDQPDNGYRSAVMHRAMTDDLVKRAVAVVSAHHLSSDVTGLESWAHRQQFALVSRLRGQAIGAKPPGLSEWITILLLLVGDTITGGSDSVYLLKMLRAVELTLREDASIPKATRDFLVVQTRMFELFGLPLTTGAGAAENIQHSDMSHYMTFLYSSTDVTSEQQQQAALAIREAMLTAFDLYVRRAGLPSFDYDPSKRLEALRIKLSPIKWSDPGAHALVWPYFVAAAESTRPQHRDFFRGRLSELFAVAKFRNIPRAVETLEHIWAVQGTRSWIQIIQEHGPILIM